MSIVYITTLQTPLGLMLAKATDVGLFYLDFTDEKDDIIISKNHILELLEIELSEYFSKKRKSFDIPILLEGTSFQKEVWNTLLKIEYGKTINYQEEAFMMQRPKACRAVANANGKNPISIIVPCHRVIAKTGSIGGYTGGVWRKEFLLELERG